MGKCFIGDLGGNALGVIPSERVRAYRVTGEFVASLLRGVADPYTSDLPEDATLVGVWWDPWQRCFYLQFHSWQFRPVREGDVVPEHALTLTLTRAEARNPVDWPEENGQVASSPDGTGSTAA